jgi:hypothetical protein
MELVKPDIIVPTRNWNTPSGEEEVYGQAATSLGDVTLRRVPSSRLDAISKAEGHERWYLLIPGGHRMETDPVGVPYFASEHILKQGTSGTYNGTAFGIQASSAFRRSRRLVSIDALGMA